ncbi:MAG: NAD-glutamate dehydrogenase domain-containing protein, partial [Candidatus Margulisiibacteriota bacterium]|nr:NAD-glutamate dehydrogenase domain-containing protein [Candidatus Margulisiibacteriota bacterium]
QSKKDRLSKIISITNHLNKYIKSVQNITEDQILRRLLSIVLACVRTNYFFKASDEALSFKFDCKDIFGIQTPVPYRETFVFDSALEGVHIRFGAVARGGLRWSDRLDDYRTEVLGLVRTQQTKNAVIIPVGSKGGFVIKKGSTSYDDGVFQYQRFITAMLQLADNIVNGKPQINSNRVAYDDFDPYFVVAADKGTATFSDFANGVSESQNFWLGDGFASGGAQGYDHKKVGITAKGAWECTKLHFKSMQQNPEEDVVTVAGVGDMSGDVFGNGMLLSKSIKLVAAFNHMHIFIDPNPNPLASWKERQRLFKKDRSVWTDYKGISKGGGIFDRSAKEITCSKEIQQLLNLNKKQLSGEELIQAILKSQVDLLWFGGIGTYIKASSESHIEAGDPSNNSVRVNANEVQSKIIGEGANLAITQKGRIEFELNKGRINTDAIDNSAGVNMSDYEVNIKILLSDLLQKKVIKTENDRNAILEKATDEVTDLVLQNNVSQHNLISLDQYRSKNQPFLVDQSISNLIKLGILNHIDEQIPTSKERHELYRQTIPLPRSVLAKCQAYVKMRIKDALVKSTIFEGQLYDDIYYNYFPNLIRSLVPTHKFPNHRLKKDIIITQLTNHFVGIYGCSAYETLTFSDQINIDQAIHHLVILEHLFDISKKRKSIEAKDLSEEDRTSQHFKINQSLLYAILFCKLQNIELDPQEIDSYKSQINEPTIKKLPLQLQCLFLNKKTTRSCDRLLELETQTSLLTNLNNLEEYNVKSQVMHDQKSSIISDLYASIIHLIDLEKALFDTLITDIKSSLNPIPMNKDAFSNLFLYSYKLRQFLIGLNK